jgi:drug/metabolite transporter (DMT)-like permease
MLALMSTASYAASGLFEKYVLNSYSGDSKAYIICQALVQQTFIIPIFVFAGIKFIYPVSLFAIVLGCLQVIPSIYYMKAMQTEEVSRVSALEYLYLILVFLGAAVLLGETLTLKHYVGGLLLMFSIILVSYRSNGKGRMPGLSPALKQFYVYWAFTAFYFLALKYFLASMDEWSLFAWASLGNLLMVVPLLANRGVRKATLNFFGIGKKSIGALLSGEVFHFIGVICSIFAYSLGSVSLVTTIGALQPFMTLISVVALSQIKPGLIDEELSSNTLLQKFISVLILCVGIYFIY